MCEQVYVNNIKFDHRERKMVRPIGVRVSLHDVNTVYIIDSFSSTARSVGANLQWNAIHPQVG